MDTILWLLKMKMRLKDTPSHCKYKVSSPEALPTRTHGMQQRLDPLTHWSTDT